MRREHLNCLMSWLPFLLAVLISVAEAQAAGEVRLQIRLRDSDGAAVVGETVNLQRLPEAEPVLPPCTTDMQGECAWTVRRGLYQVLFARPLDDVSILAVAEGGLRGFGLTVGDEPITYHFTFHSDGRVYFDAAPGAAVPVPIIPVGDVLLGGIAPSPTPSLHPESSVAVTTTPSPEQTAPENTAANATAGSSWRLLLFVGGGLLIGGGLHLWSHKKQTPDQKTKRPTDQTTKRPGDQTTKRPPDEETNHA